MTATSLTEALSPATRYQRAVEAAIERRDRLTARQVRALFGLLVDMRRRVIADLADLSDGESYRAWQLRQLQAAIDGRVVELARRFGGLLNGAMGAAWEQGAAMQANGLAAAGIDLALRDIDLTALAIAQDTAAELVRRVSADFRARARREVAVGVMGGQSPTAVMRAVARLLAAEPARQRMGPIASQAERIVRTEMMGAFSLADEARSRELAEEVPGLRKWWDAAEDGRTRPDHAAAERRYRPGGSEGPIPLRADFTVGGEKASGPHDPRLSARQRVNCRCVRRVWSPEWGE